MKAKFTAEDVQKLAKLSHLHLEGGESERLSAQLSEIIGYVQQLEAVDVSGVEPMSHVHGSTNIFRNDVAQPSMGIESLMQNAPDRSGRFIRVPIIVE